MKKETIKIMIVDGSTKIVKRLRAILSDVKNIAYVCSASDYNEAIIIMDLMLPNVVLLDINLQRKCFPVLFE